MGCICIIYILVRSSSAFFKRVCSCPAYIYIYQLYQAMHFSKGFVHAELNTLIHRLLRAGYITFVYIRVYVGLCGKPENKPYPFSKTLCKSTISVVRYGVCGIWLGSILCMPRHLNNLYIAVLKTALFFPHKNV